MVLIKAGLFMNSSKRTSSFHAVVGIIPRLRPRGSSPLEGGGYTKTWSQRHQENIWALFYIKIGWPFWVPLAPLGVVIDWPENLNEMSGFFRSRKWPPAPVCRGTVGMNPTKMTVVRPHYPLIPLDYLNTLIPRGEHFKPWPCPLEGPETKFFLIETLLCLMIFCPGRARFFLKPEPP